MSKPQLCRLKGCTKPVKPGRVLCSGKCQVEERRRKWSRERVYTDARRAKDK